MIFDSDTLIKQNPFSFPFYNCQRYIQDCFIDGKKPDWKYISGNFDLPNWFIRQNIDKLDWETITWKQTLTINDMREFKDYIKWDVFNISEKLQQRFLENDNFVREFKNKLNMKKLRWKINKHEYLRRS